MKKILIIIALVFAGGLLVWSILSDDYTPDVQIRKSGPIVVLGDSLVVGVGSTKGNDFVSLLSKNIGEEILNRGISGNTTQDGLNRLEKDVIENNPRIVIILLGGNDFIKRVPRDKTFKNLSEIITRIRDSDAVPVLLGVRGGILGDSYEKDYEKLAKDTNTLYVSNVLKDLIGNSEYMYDGIHPNDLGYAIVAERVLEVIESMIE